MSRRIEFHEEAAEVLAHHMISKQVPFSWKGLKLDQKQFGFTNLETAKGFASKLIAKTISYSFFFGKDEQTKLDMYLFSVSPEDFKVCESIYVIVAGPSASNNEPEIKEDRENAGKHD